MATLVVAAASAAGWFGAQGAISTAVITAAAYATAAYVDSLWISQISQPDPIEGPKAGSIRLNSTEEGDPVQEAYGRECRVAGHVLDVSELIEARNTTTANGKGGSGAEFTEYTYSCHAMISFGLGPAEDITRIRANGKTIWAKYPNISINSTAISGTVLRQDGYDPFGSGYSTNSAYWNNTTKTLTWSSTSELFEWVGPPDGPFTANPLIGSPVLILNPAVVGLNGSSFLWSGFTASWNEGNETYTYSVTISTASSVTNGYVAVQFARRSQPSTLKWVLTLTSTSSAADLSEIQIAGGFVEISAPASNVGTFRVIDSGTLPNGDTYCKLISSNYINPFVPFSAGTTTTLFQNNPSFSPKKMAEAPNFHRGPVSGLLGAEDATVDELFTSLRTPNPVPAYRGKIVVTFKGLQLFDYGNTLPQFEADVVQSSTAEVKDYIGQVCRDAGLGDEEFEAYTITNTLLGLPMRGPSDARDRIAPVLIGYELVTSEKDGVLRFSYRKDVPTATVDAQDLSAREIGAETIRPVTFADLGDEPADSIVVTYRQKVKDYTVGVAQYNRRAEAPRMTQRIDLSLLQMEDADAQALAMHTALIAPVNRRQVELTLPLSYVDSVYEGVRISVPVNGRTREILVMGVTRGPTGVLEVMGIIEQSSIFDLAVSTYTPLTPGFVSLGQDAGTFGNTPITFTFLDTAPLRDEHRNKVGFYLAACSESRSTRFPGAMLYQALDENEEEWRPISRIHVDSVMGRCTTTLGDAVIGVWDEINTLDVELTAGELESVTELACLNGRNRAMVAREIIGFRTATLIGTNTYRLSGLLRGLRDTGLQMEQHVEGESFVLLTGKGLEFVELETAAIGMSRSYKMLTPGMRLPEAETFQFTCSGSSTTCFAPDHIKGTRDVSNNLTIEWTRVSRANVRLLSTQAIPISEPFERYEVRIFDATTVDLLRVFSVAQPSVHYSAAQQTADGLTLGEKVYVTVRQLGDLVHGGNARTAVV